MRKPAILLVALLTILVAVGNIGCDSETTGALPTLEVGDKWVSRLTASGIEYTETREVTGESKVDGKDCYVVDISSDPALPGLTSSVTQEVEKATLWEMTARASGEAMGVPFETARSISREVTGDAPWPLQTGREWVVTETETLTTTSMGEMRVEPSTAVYTYKVEAVETVIVPAGTFECFRTVKYDEDGNAVQTMWRSDKVKQFGVKAVRHATGDFSELLSYSLR
jgi:hypothetical protein